MTLLAVHLAALDDAWSHAWESLTQVLAGMSEAEGAWQAPGFAEEEHEPDWPPEGSVLWHVAHLAHCKRYYAAVIRARAEASAPDAVARVPRADLSAERAALETAHAEQRAALVGIGGEDLSRMACGKMPLGEFLAMTIRHDAWHGGQIALLRRLHRALA